MVILNNIFSDATSLHLKSVAFKPLSLLLTVEGQAMHVGMQGYWRWYLQRFGLLYVVHIWCKNTTKLIPPALYSYSLKYHNSGCKGDWNGGEYFIDHFVNLIMNSIRQRRPKYRCLTKKL